LKVPALETLETFIDQVTLDIGLDRGLFIITPDRKLQLRMPGSERFHAILGTAGIQNLNSQFDLAYE
jgi:hypothetical protein